MAINITTLKADADAVSDLIETESDTQAHYDAMITDIKADADTVTAVYSLAKDCVKICAALGIGPKFYDVEGQTYDQ